LFFVVGHGGAAGLLGCEVSICDLGVYSMIYHYGEVGGREGGRERARQRQRQREGGGGLGGGRERERRGRWAERQKWGEGDKVWAI
jgi:hypothetical protein